MGAEPDRKSSNAGFFLGPNIYLFNLLFSAVVGVHEDAINPAVYFTPVLITEHFLPHIILNQSHTLALYFKGRAQNFTRLLLRNFRFWDRTFLLRIYKLPGL